MCNEVRHLAKDCHKTGKSITNKGKLLTYYNCWKKGHMSMESEPKSTSGQAMYYEGKVNRVTVTDILLTQDILEQCQVHNHDMMGVVAIMETLSCTFWLLSK